MPTKRHIGLASRCQQCGMWPAFHMSSMWHKENVSEPSMCHAFSVLIHVDKLSWISVLCADYVADEGTLPCHLNVMRTHPYASYLSCRNFCVKQSHSGGGYSPGKIPWQHFPAERKGHGALRLKKEPTQSSAPQKMMASSRDEEEFIYRIFRGTS